ncbi:MAG: hypothetical protein K2M73_09480 [Lachnospiraceae bacterium]|nr:hypothetical protein [Lachnospiraceae bacterium]
MKVSNSTATGSVNGSTDVVYNDCFTDEQRARFNAITDGINGVLNKFGGLFSESKTIKDAAYGVMFARCTWQGKGDNKAAKVANSVLPLVNIGELHQYIVDICKLANEVVSAETIYTKYLVPSILDNYSRQIVKRMIANEKQLTPAARDILNEVISIKGYSYSIYSQVKHGNLAQRQMFEDARKHVGSFAKYVVRAFGSFVNSKLSFA